MKKQGNVFNGTPKMTAVNSPNIKSEDRHSESPKIKCEDHHPDSSTIKSEDPLPESLSLKEGENNID